MKQECDAAVAAQRLLAAPTQPDIRTLSRVADRVSPGRGASGWRNERLLRGDGGVALLSCTHTLSRDVSKSQIFLLVHGMFFIRNHLTQASHSFLSKIVLAYELPLTCGILVRTILSNPENIDNFINSSLFCIDQLHLRQLHDPNTVCELIW